MHYKPYDYQKKAINALYDLFHMYEKSYVLLVSPTGSGKTVIASHIIESATKLGNKVLFLAHRRELINQCSNKLNEIGVDHGVIMGNHPRYAPHKSVQIASVQTLNNRNKPEVDLIIVDEAHRSLARSYQSIFECYNEVPVLGLTATPWRGDGRPLGEFYHSMHIVAQVQELVDKKFLLAPTVYIPNNPHLEDVTIIGGDYVESELDLIMNTTPSVDIIVNQWKTLTPDKRTVVFACTVNHSKNIINEFRANGIAAEHIDCTTNIIERDAILSRLKSGETKIVSNVGVLTEGWDLPELECVVLARPTKSLTLYLQMVGRGMRIYEGKISTFVIDCGGCTLEHGLVTDLRDFSLLETKKTQVSVPNICPNCKIVSNAPSRRCSVCDCSLDMGYSKSTEPFTIEDTKPKCAKCGSTDLRKCKEDRLIGAKPYKCNSCGEISFLLNLYTGYADTKERIHDYKLLLNTEHKYYKGWAKFRYREIYNEWPSERAKIAISEMEIE